MQLLQKIQSQRPLVLAACLMATFMAAFESTVIVTAMPSIVADIGGFSLYSWTFSIFLITQAISIPLYGRLADSFGRKNVFYLGSGLFLLGSALCGFASSMAWLILFRALQGLGAGGVQPIVMTICGDLYSPAERAWVQGLISSVFGVAAVAGPLLGAFLVEHGAWPAVFWISLPVGVAAIAMISVFLHEQVEPRRHRIDYVGFVLLAVACGALLLLLVQGGSLSTGVAIAAAVLGVFAAAALLLHEARTPEPMLPLELWRDRIIAVGSVGNGLVSAVMMGIVVFLPAYVQGLMDSSPLAAGLVVGIMSVTWALASVLSGGLMARTSYRSAAILGAALLVAGSLVLVALTPAKGPVWAGAGSLLIGAGMGLCNTAFIVSIQAAVPWAQRGAATSSCLFARFVGQALGVASFGAILNATILSQAPEVMYAGVVDQFMEWPWQTALSVTDRNRLIDVVAAGLHNGYWFAVVLSVAALLLVLLLPAHASPRQLPP